LNVFDNSRALRITCSSQVVVIEEEIIEFQIGLILTFNRRSLRDDVIREFKLYVSGNGERQVRTLLAKFSLNVFVSYFLSCAKRIIMHCSFTGWPLPFDV
jgi:hypothetical protein